MSYFLIIVVALLALMYTYVGRRIVRPARLHNPWKSVAWTAIYMCAALPVIPHFLLHGNIELAWIDRISWVGYVSMGFFLLLFTYVAIRDILALIVRLFVSIKRLIHPAPASNPGPNPAINSERRRFLIHASNLGILGLTGSLTGYGFWQARRRPAVVSVTVPLPNLPESFDGYRIAQITDIHAGPTIKRDWIQAVVDEVNRQTPGLIAFTGDLVDGSVPYLRDDVAPMGELAAPDGVYFITGNHEYYSGVLPWIDEVKRIGLTVLLNEHVVIPRDGSHMLLAGVTDYHGGSFLPSHKTDPRGAIANAPPCDFKVLLAHQPMSIHEASKIGYDLQLSGHTHGGQFFPGSVLARLAQPYLYGLHKHGNTWIYVSRGTGYWGPPIRIGEPSEVTMVTLRRAPQPA